MAYDENLANRIRTKLIHLDNVIEKKMMGGLTFMVNDKMCVGIIKDELMCRLNPEHHEAQIQKMGCRTMDFTHKPMHGYVLIDETGLSNHQDFNYWINAALEFNKISKASKKK